MVNILRRVMGCVAAVVTVGAFLISGAVCEAAAANPISLTDDEQEYVRSAPVLRVGYVQDRIPVSFTDNNGELAGVSRFIFDRISEISGLTFEYVPLPGGAVTYDYLMNEHIDLVTSVEYNKKNQDARGILMSDPYISSRKVIVAREDFTYSSDGTHSVALCSGSQTIKSVLKDAYPNYTIVDYDSITDCFSAVKSGETDMMILNQYVVEYWLYKPSYDDLKVIPVLGMDEQLCFSAVVPFDENANPIGDDGERIISIINKSIACMADDEVDGYTIRAIMENRYSFTIGDFLYQYRFTFIALTIAVFLIVGLAVMLMRQRIQSLAAKADAKAKSRFMSTMSHEIRTPLNGLIGLNYLMSRKLDDKAQMSKYLEQSTTTAKYLQSLVSNVLDMSMIDSNDVRIEHKPVDLRVLLSTVEAIVQGGMANKRIEFHMDVELLYPDIVGDGVRIQQILLNLLDNARKFTHEGGRVEVTVRQTIGDGGMTNTRISVADNGKGMDEESQKNIFDAFVQNHETVSKGDRGVGLGLAISHRLALLMDGDITFTSEPDRGSEFLFSFEAPLCEPTNGFESDPADKNVKPRILVAEDNELNGEIMMDLLAESGFEAELVADGREALETFSASEPGEYGVILMDLLMPEMDGFAAAAAIRSLKREDARTVRIFACSANCTTEDRQKAFSSGMDDFLAKPIDMGMLLEKLKG